MEKDGDLLESLLKEIKQMNVYLKNINSILIILFAIVLVIILTQIIIPFIIAL
jgi:hypothetical protein